MALQDLAVVVLKQIGAVAVQHARPTRRDRCSVAPGADAITGSFGADMAVTLTNDGPFTVILDVD